jgi:hypothetical protein
MTTRLNFALLAEASRAAPHKGTHPQYTPDKPGPVERFGEAPSAIVGRRVRRRIAVERSYV